MSVSLNDAGDYNEKGAVSLLLSSPKQQKSIACIVAWFLWKHCWLQERQETVRLFWRSILELKKGKLWIYKCLVVSSPDAWLFLLSEGATKQGENEGRGLLGSGLNPSSCSKSK